MACYVSWKWKFKLNIENERLIKHKFCENFSCSQENLFVTKLAQIDRIVLLKLAPLDHHIIHMAENCSIKLHLETDSFTT